MLRKPVDGLSDPSPYAGVTRIRFEGSTARGSVSGSSHPLGPGHCSIGRRLEQRSGSSFSGSVHVAPLSWPQHTTASRRLHEAAMTEYDALIQAIALR